MIPFPFYVVTSDAVYFCYFQWLRSWLLPLDLLLEVPLCLVRGETRSDDVRARIGPSRKWVDAPKEARDRFDLLLAVP